MAKGIKTGGRLQGTPNLITKEMREILIGIIAKEIEIIPETLAKLESEKRLELIIKLLPYVLPKLESLSIHDETPNTELKKQCFIIGGQKIEF
jgi:hypothetical protein